MKRKIDIEKEAQELAEFLKSDLVKLYSAYAIRKNLEKQFKGAADEIYKRAIEINKVKNV